MTLPVHVAYHSTQGRERWRAGQALHPDLAVELRQGAGSLCALVNALIADDEEPLALVCHEDVLLPEGFGQRAQELARLLDSILPDGWAAASNVGLSFNGVDRYRLYSPIGALSRTLAPTPVAQIGDDVILLSLRNLRKHAVRLPELPGRAGGGVVLSLEALRHGLECVVDSRLFCFREGPEPTERALRFLRSDPFAGYFTSRFVNHAFTTYHGTVDYSRATDYRFLDYDHDSGDRRDLQQSYADSVERITRATRPSLTVVCRTRFDRPAMLTRAIRSIAIASGRAPGLEVRARIVVAAQDTAPYASEIERLRSLVGTFPLDVAAIAPTERYPRTELMLQALRQATSDYVWFLDDDDFLTPDALAHLRGAVNLAKSNLIIGDTAVYEESWDEGPGGATPTIETWQPGKGYRARDYLRSLTGTNFVPNCAIVYPVPLMQRAMADVAALGDYNEDYFFLCLALSAPYAEVALIHRPIAGVARHNRGNTVTETDRSHWHQSFISFIAELANRPQAGSPLLWELARSNSDALAKAEGSQALSRQKLQVFVGKDDTFREDHSVTEPLDLGEHLQRRTIVLHELDGDTLRIDVGERPSLVTIDTLELRYFTGTDWSSCTWVADGCAQRLLDTRGMVQVLGPEGATGRFFVVSSDPQLRLRLPADLAWSADPELRLALSLVELPAAVAGGFEVAPEAALTKLALLGGDQQELRLRRLPPASGLERVPLEPTLDRQALEIRFDKEPGEGAIQLEFGDQPAYLDFEQLTLSIETADGAHQLRWSDGWDQAHVTKAVQLTPLPAGAKAPRRWLVTAPGAHISLALPWELVTLTGPATLRLALRYIPLPQLRQAAFEVPPNASLAPSPPPQSLQLYWPRKGSHTEEYSARCDFEQGARRQELEFEFDHLPEGPLRLDIGDVPAFVEFHQIQLSSLSDPTRPTYDWCHPHATAHISSAHNLVLLSAQDRPQRWLATGQDPFLLLEVPAALRHPGRACLRVQLSYVPLPVLQGHEFTSDQIIRAGRRQEAKLYPGRGGGYSEADTVACPLDTGRQIQTHRFRFAGMDGGPLRLDPGEVACYFEIHAAHLKGSDGSVLQQWLPGAALTELHAGPGTTALKTADGAFFAAVCNGDDPQVYLSSSGVAQDGPLELIVELRYQPLDLP